MFFRSKEQAYFLAGRDGEPVDKEGRPVRFFAGALVYGLENRYDNIIKILEKVIFVLTGVIVTGAYALARVPPAFLAVLLITITVCLAYIALKRIGAVAPKKSQVVCDGVSYSDFILKRIGYKAIFGPLGTFKSFLRSMFVALFMLGLAYIFYLENGSNTEVFVVAMSIIGGIFIFIGLFFWVISLVGAYIYRNSKTMPADLQITSSLRKK